MSTTINELVEAARLHFNHLRADITNASTRIEHIRLTTLAQEAENLLINLEKFAAGSTGSIPVELSTKSGTSGCCSDSSSSNNTCVCAN
jgi:hypothetical protein